MSIVKYISKDGNYSEEKTDIKIEIFKKNDNEEQWKLLESLITKDMDILCKNNISSSYIAGGIPDYIQIIIILSYLKNDISNTIGFMTITTSNNCLYIDVICANASSANIQLAAGKILMIEVEEYAKLNGYECLELSSLLHVVNFYRKIGFRFVKDKNDRENPEIARLAELNKTRFFSSFRLAYIIMKIELALQLTNGPDKTGKSLLENMTILEVDKNLTEDNAKKMVNDYLPDFVIERNGHDGYYDLIAAVVKSGFVRGLRGKLNIRNFNNIITMRKYFL